jgi:hypothetical protein|tara:strand:+ start:254 stop:493 length:240 start_codon:yes stop_codon:yes gene_type:complete
MAIFKLEIADGDVDRVFDSVCTNYGWDAGSEETKGDFTHRIVRRFLSENVAAFEKENASKQALDQLDTSVNLSDPNPEG